MPIWGDACVAPARRCALHRHDEYDGGRRAGACGGRPGATRMPCAQRLLKWSQQKPTPENPDPFGTGNKGRSHPSRRCNAARNKHRHLNRVQHGERFSGLSMTMLMTLL